MTQEFTLKSARMYRNKTIKETADYLQVTNQTIYNWENRKSVIPADKFLILCLWLDLEPKQFIL
jgi:transcriptional regulator with XRE-family HTH domain